MHALAYLLAAVLLWPCYAHAFDTATLRDDFNRANEGPPPSSSWTTAVRGATLDPSGLIVSTNTLGKTNSPTGNGSAFWNVETFGPDTWVTADCPDCTTAGIIILFVRLQSAGTSGADGYACRWSPDTPLLFIQRLDNGTLTTLASNSTDVNDGAKLGCEVIGSNIKAWVDTGSGWTEALSTIDTTYTAAGHVGVLMSANTAFLDNFGAHTVSAGGGGGGGAILRRRN